MMCIQRYVKIPGLSTMISIDSCVYFLNRTARPFIVLRNVSRFTDGFKACRGRGELNSDDVLHTRSVKEMLDDDRVVPGRSHRRFNIIHLETLATWCFRRCALCSFLADAGLLKVENHPKRQNRVHLKVESQPRMIPSASTAPLSLYKIL